MATVIEFFEDPFLLSGAVAAFAHELVYWTNVVRRQGNVRAPLVFLSFLYIFVGAALAKLLSLDEQFARIPIALGVGYLWNDLLKALSGVALTVAKAKEILDRKMDGIGSG